MADYDEVMEAIRTVILITEYKDHLKEGLRNKTPESLLSGVDTLVKQTLFY